MLGSSSGDRMAQVKHSSMPWSSVRVTKMIVDKVAFLDFKSHGEVLHKFQVPTERYGRLNRYLILSLAL